MKRIAGVLTIIATTSFLAAANLLGAEPVSGKASGKDQCLLVAMTCANNVDSINQKIERLNREIAKGTAVYTVDELRILRNKLDDAVKLLGDLTRS